jgi:hypothetical protein
MGGLQLDAQSPDRLKNSWPLPDQMRYSPFSEWGQPAGKNTVVPND